MTDAGATAGSRAMDGRLGDPERLAAVRESGLAEPEGEQPAFDRVTRVAARLLGVPLAMFDVLTDAELIVASAAGRDGPGAGTRIPADKSLCQLVVRRDAPVRIDDVGADPVAAAIIARQHVRVGAYIGVPVRSADGLTLGALCAIDEHARVWTEGELEGLQDLAGLLHVELRLRASLGRQRATAEALAQSGRLLHEALDGADRLERRHQDTRLATVYALAHAVRTPLFSIRGVAEVVLDFERSAPPTFLDDLRAIDDAAVEALRVVDERIAQTRLDGAPAPRRETLVDLRALIMAVCAVITADPHPPVKIVLDALEVPVVRGDPVRLAQMLRHLITDAFQERTGGEVHLAIAAAGPGRISIDVSHDGPNGAARSVAHAVQPTVEDPWEEHPTPELEPGLPLAAHLARSLGGEIHNRRDAGRRTHLTATIDAATAL